MSWVTGSIATSAEYVLWRTQEGFRCVARRYDEQRYQLRLAWCNGTVKSDLFQSYEAALAAASVWRLEIQAKQQMCP